MAHQRLEVDHFFPERRTVEEHGNRAVELVSLRQRQDLEQLVERAEAARERDQGARQVREPQLAHEEVVELEAELRSDIRVGTLLLRQTDVEPHAAASGERCSPIGGLHDSRAPARADEQAFPGERAAPFGHEPRELHCLFDVATQGAVGTHARRAEEHHGRSDPRGTEGAQRRQVL